MRFDRRRYSFSVRGVAVVEGKGWLFDGLRRFRGQAAARGEENDEMAEIFRSLRMEIPEREKTRMRMRFVLVIVIGFVPPR